MLSGTGMDRWKALVAVCAGTLCVGLGACAKVPAYQRERLAHPTMRPDYGQSLARQHTHAIHEGAQGGDLGMTSGCGCN
jgi:hypothetical protein